MSLSVEPVKPRPTVWIVNKGGHNYGTAEKFGHLVPLTSESVNPFAIDRLLVNIGRRLTVAKEGDYILISGLPLLNALVVCKMLSKFEKVNILQWSVKKGKYVELTLWRSNVDEAGKGEPV